MLPSRNSAELWGRNAKWCRPRDWWGWRGVGRGGSWFGRKQSETRKLLRDWINSCICSSSCLQSVTRKSGLAANENRFFWGDIKSTDRNYRSIWQIQTKSTCLFRPNYSIKVGTFDYCYANVALSPRNELVKENYCVSFIKHLDVLGLKLMWELDINSCKTIASFRLYWSSVQPVHINKVTGQGSTLESGFRPGLEATSTLYLSWQAIKKI